jgi:chromosomal replication initiator protein
LELPAQLEPIGAWREICAELRRAVGDSTYEIWLTALELRSLRDGVLLLSAPEGTQSWVVKRFGRVLESCARTVLGDGVRVAFDDLSPGPEPRSRRGTRGPVQPASASEPPGDSLNPRLSFEQFIIGDGNRLAHAAALAVAELPGQAYNPLFLHAPPGLGKTHLLHAIGNYVLAFGGGATVRYTTVEAFTNHFITALNARSLDRFKHAYRDADVLLIDDVQFLASKAKTEEEFFHTFNAVYETGRQLVITCDRLPRQLAGVEERLRERFEAGLVVDVRPPDYPTRITILRKRVALDRIPVDDVAVLELIARRVTSNVRALEGALIRVVASHSLTGRRIDVGLAGSVLDEMYPQLSTATLTIDAIQQVVASHFGISVDELVSARRTNRIAWPRQVAIYLARELTAASLPGIGSEFGGRNHATVLHACKRVSARIKAEPEVGSELAALADGITAQRGDRSC